MWPKLYTMRIAYQQITQGERPWNALGDFLNYWFAYAAEQREALVNEPIEEPANVTEATADPHRWAVFCAASVEYLCDRYAVPCPDWVHDPVYQSLPDPWFMGVGADKPHIQAWLKQETPEPFTRRTIYCGNRMFLNKYEMAVSKRLRQPVSTMSAEDEA